MTASVNRYINPYFYQQHKQLDLTTIAPKTTHWALRDLLKTIVVNRVVNYRQFGGVFGLSRKNALRIGNPKQKLRGDRKKGNYIRADTTINNKDYYYQQHKQLDLTTIAPKTTHWALRDLLKTIVVNRVVNYRQFGGVFGLSWKNALGALATQNKMKR